MTCSLLQQTFLVIFFSLVDASVYSTNMLAISIFPRARDGVYGTTL